MDEDASLLTGLGIAAAVAELCKLLVGKGVLSATEIDAALEAAHDRIEANGRQTGMGWETAIIPIMTIRSRLENELRRER